MAKLNEDGKWTTFWIVKSAPDGGPPIWRQIDPFDPALKEDPELAGADSVGPPLRIENDDQVMVVTALDEPALKRVESSLGDAAALVQEHGIPHKPYSGDMTIE